MKVKILTKIKIVVNFKISILFNIIVLIKKIDKNISNEIKIKIILFDFKIKKKIIKISMKIGLFYKLQFYYLT
jgi:hypothetical protein